LIVVQDMCEQPSDQDYAAGLKKQQMVAEFDMATWRVRLQHFLPCLLVTLMAIASDQRIQHHRIEDSTATTGRSKAGEPVVRMMQHQGRMTVSSKLVTAVSIQMTTLSGLHRQQQVLG